MNLPCHAAEALARLDEAKGVMVQCAPDADPLYQDFRYNIICDTIAELHNRGIEKSKLQRWTKRIQALYPWSPGYDIFRQNFNRRFVVFPWIIAMTTEEKQVVRSLEIARKYKIPICVRGGAHCYEPYSICDGMVIDQSRRTKITVDPKSRRVTIEPGVLNGPLAVELGRHGLAIPQGTCANVGVVGLCLSGGMGFLGRKFGLTTDSLISFNLLTADGKIVKADRNHHPDLFWACRGAGNGNFGVVTELTLQAYTVKQVVVFELRWSIDRLQEILDLYFSWLRHDNKISMELNVYQISQDNPYPLMVTGMYVKDGDHDNVVNKLRRHLQDFLATDPSMCEIRSSSYVEAARNLTYRRFPPSFFKNKSVYAYTRPPRKVASIIKRYMSRAGPTDRVEFMGLGSTYRKCNIEDTAFPHRKAWAWVQLMAKWGSSSDTAAGRQDETLDSERIAWVTEFYDELNKAWGQGVRGSYVGCFDSQLPKPLESYYGANLPRLLQIKRKWDPKNVFAYPQGLSQSA